ncbi:MAG: SMP-30/gluconolactonase/LRE family protein [Desulfobacteraceae bacterium]|nr:SMP-30/gluconolactonase/LRE family protein [Desulfobacteraceae bacterium]
MEQPAFTTLISGYSFLEAPRWHDNRLWLSDFYLKQVIAVDPNGGVEVIAEVPGQPSGLGWLPDGRLLIVSMTDRKLLRREKEGSLVEHADLSEVAGGHANDMVVDSQGRAYVGNFGFDLMAGAPLQTASLARVDPDGTVSVAAEGLYFPNGSMITPDGQTLIVNETFANRISAFDIRADGSLGSRRDWAVLGPMPKGRELAEVIPQAKVASDGGVLDAEGAVWLADAIGNRALRVAEGGRILDEIATGGQGVFACTLGGVNRQTLYLCVAPDFAEHNRKAAREAAIWAVEVDVPGAGLP